MTIQFSCNNLICDNVSELYAKENEEKEGIGS